MQAQTYRYGLCHRPAHLGAVPNGYIAVEDPLPSPLGGALTRHGVIVYAEPLSEDQIRAFELVLLADQHLIAELADAVATKLLQYADGYLEMHEKEPSQFRQTVTDSMRKLRTHSVYAGEEGDFTDLVAARLREIDQEANRFNFEIHIDDRLFFKGDESSLAVIVGNLNGRNWSGKAYPKVEFEMWRSYMSSEYETALPVGSKVTLRSPKGIVLEETAIGHGLTA